MKWYQDDSEIAAALKARLNREVDPDDVFLARDHLALEFPVSAAGVRRIQSRIETAAESNLPSDSWSKAVRQSYREAEESCRQHEELAHKARTELFGHHEPPFPSSDKARRWIEERQSHPP